MKLIWQSEFSDNEGSLDQLWKYHFLREGLYNEQVLLYILCSQLLC